MGTRRLAVTAVTVILTLTAGGCSGTPTPPRAKMRPATSPLAAAPLTPDYQTFPVGVRTLHLQRGHSRPLPTLIFYPATAHTLTELTNGRRPQLTDGLFAPATRPEPATQANPTAAQPIAPAKAARRAGLTAQADRAVPAYLAARVEASARAGLPPAAGRFPLVLFSHGLSGSPERYAPALAEFAAAGFIVVAPTYPYTSEFAIRFRRTDIARQPADARYVLSRVLRLNYTPGDPLWHRIDAQHIAAVGHSAGGYTTTGLFTAGHDPRLRAGVIMAGWAAPGAFAGAPASMLFLQGTADPVVPMAVSRAAWKRVPWPKAYMLLRRNSHSTFLQPGDLGYPTMKSTVINFLRWTLNGDEAAGLRLPRMVYPGPSTRR